MNTNTETTLSTPIKEDEAFWKHHVSSQKTSGLTRKQYSEAHHINYHRFGYWIKKYSAQVQPSSFVSVQVKSPIEASNLPTLCTLHLKNGVCLNIHDKDVISTLLERML